MGESGGGKTCCKSQKDDNTKCDRWHGRDGNPYAGCWDKVDGSGAGCALHGFTGTVAPRATSGLPGFSAVATEPRGHLAVDGPGASNNYSAFSLAPLAPASVRWGP